MDYDKPMTVGWFCPLNEPKWVEINQLSNDREFTIISSYTAIHTLNFVDFFFVEVVGRGNKNPKKTWRF